jgi:phage-related protein
MEFKIEFYETEQGRCPVRDFLDEIKTTDPNNFAIILAGINKLKWREYHHSPLSRHIGQGLYELRHVGKLNTRIFYFFARRRSIVLVHGMVKKGRKIPKRERDTALRRKKDWEQRHLT